MSRLATATFLVFFALFGVGCSSRAPQLTPTPSSTAAAQGETQPPAPQPPAEERPPTDPDLGPVAATPNPELEMPDLEPLAESDDLLPGEVVSVSPLDEIATVELPDDLPEIALLPIEQPPAPEFDIPMVVNDRVRFWLDYYSARHHDNFRVGLVRSGRYLAMFQEIFAEAGLPRDLVYMAHVESAFKTNAYSRARAMGVWQFISSTARHYGLKIDYWLDERRDPELAARAAAAYLTDLYEEFDDWYLAIAAYNAGEGKIRRAIARTGKKDFWAIARTNSIRRETKNYVPAILAATLIHKDPSGYGFDFVADDRIVYDTIMVEGAVDLQVIAECAGSDFAMLQKLNPAMRRNQTPPHATTAVRLPVGRSGRTLQALAEVPLEERVLYVRHRVRGGDTLYELARSYGVSVGAIQQANQMGRRTMIRAGKDLIIPTVAAGRYSSSRAVASTGGGSAAGGVITYRVRRGDTLSHVARRYSTSPSAIAAINGMRTSDVLSIGRRLKVAPGARTVSQARQIARSGQAGREVASSGSGERVHTVRRGDTLWEIAGMYNTTVSKLCRLNRISQHSTLYPGTRLTVAD